MKTGSHTETYDYSYYDMVIRYHELNYRYLQLIYPELRGNGQNYIKDDKGRFAGSRPGGGSGGGTAQNTDTDFVGSVGIIRELKNIGNALEIYRKSAIIDTGEHEMYPDSIAGVKRGEPMSFEQADSGRANPNFSLFFQDEFYINCQSSVIAHKARIRGYDVQAKGFDKNNILMSNLSHFPTKAWIDPKMGKEPKIIKYNGSSDKCGSWLDGIVGQGERYSFEYRHEKGRHIITASRDSNGILRLYDPQRNIKHLGVESINSAFGKKDENSNFKMHHIEIMRVDNLDFNLSYANAVLKK